MHRVSAEILFHKKIIHSSNKAQSPSIYMYILPTFLVGRLFLKNIKTYYDIANHIQHFESSYFLGENKLKQI